MPEPPLPEPAEPEPPLPEPAAAAADIAVFVRVRLPAAGDSLSFPVSAASAEPVTSSAVSSSSAEAVAREKMIDPGLVIEAMEDSLARAAKSRYGAEMDIRVSIDRKTGNAQFTRVRTVVEDDAVENYQAQFTARDAKPYFEVRKDARWLRDGAPILTASVTAALINDRGRPQRMPREWAALFGGTLS